MPMTSRAIARICVGFLAAVCTLDAWQATQTAPPPPVSSTQEVQTAATPPPPAPRPLTPLTAEQRAFQDATRIQDPVQKLEALTKLQSELAAAPANAAIRPRTMRRSRLGATGCRGGTAASRIRNSSPERLRSIDSA